MPAEGAAGRGEPDLPEPPPAPAGANPTPSEPAPRVMPPPASGVAPLAPAKSEQLVKRASVPAPEGDTDGVELSRPQRPRWYGWKTLTSDASAILLTVAALGLEESDVDVDTASLSISALLAYEFVPGIIHFTHKNPGRGFGSMGMRLGLPLAGAFLGASVASGCDEYGCEAGGAALGFLLGIGGAIAIDAAVFAYDEPERADAHHPSLLPLVAVTPRGALLGFAGAL